MKNILIVLILVCVGFVSCDGRKSQSESLKESIEKFKDSVGPIEIIKYIPKDYAENVTDTILSNGFRIKIKTFTDMEHGIVDSISIKDSITSKTIRRDFLSEVTVFKNDRQIFSKTIDKSTFEKQYELIKGQLKEMILSSVWVNQVHDNDKDIVQIEFDFCLPENLEKEYSSRCYIHFRLMINPDGTYSFSSIEY